MQYPETESRAVSQKALRHDWLAVPQLSYWGCVRDHKVHHDRLALKPAKPIAHLCGLAPLGYTSRRFQGF